jgi:hypothetical protein
VGITPFVLLQQKTIFNTQSNKKRINLGTLPFFFRQTPCEKQPYLVPELLLVFVVSLLSLVWILPSCFRLLVWTVKQLQRCPCPTPSYAQLGLEMKLKTPWLNDHLRG